MFIGLLFNTKDGGFLVIERFSDYDDHTAFNLQTPTELRSIQNYWHKQDLLELLGGTLNSINPECCDPGRHTVQMSYCR